MRDNLNKLIKKSICIHYQLPTKDLNKISISNDFDLCLKSDNDMSIVEIIYNSIIDYCLNDSEIDITKLDSDQLFAIENRLRFDYDNSEQAQIRYGFYGETLLNILLYYFCKTKKNNC